MAGTQKVPAISIIYRPQTKIIIFQVEAFHMHFLNTILKTWQKVTYCLSPICTKNKFNVQKITGGIES
jgi:hypothetical protein